MANVYGSWRTKSPYTRYSERNCLSVEPLSTGLILLRLVYLPRTRGQLWLGALEAGYWFYVGDAYRRPQISSICLTLYCFGRHGSFVLPWNMTSLSFLFFSPLK